MGTLYDYLKWRGDLTFTEAPINEVDSMIFSLLSYLDLKGIVPEHHSEMPISIRTAANAFFSKNPDPKKISMGVIVPKEIITLFRTLKSTRRFRNVEIRAYVNEIDTKKQMQFSAMSFFPGDGTMLIAYRGTDDTLIGWKENFNMSFMPVVPAQLAATEYLDQAGAYFDGDIRLTGHSKGGNLAVYAAVHCQKPIKKRLVRVWSNDGPGFGEGMLSDPAYIAMRPIIKSLVPQSSVVGMLLEHDENYTVVKSRQVGPLQHDGFSWNVMGGSFVHLQNVTDECKRFDKSLNEWVRSMTPEQREEFVESIYQMLSAGDAATLTDLVASAKANLLKKKNANDPKVQKSVQKTIAALIELNTKNWLKDVFQKKDPKK
ncbi:MAG: DUF2974 domain-containing protein [Clostridia bacterium]|nr:DUF2974 domain-containing protein [Clostridia bacterium]